MTADDKSAFFGQTADQIGRQVERQMARELGRFNLSLRQKLALACRILADEGHARTLAGQITVRGETDGTFWSTRFGSGFAEATASNLLCMDSEMRTLEGEGMANPAVRFHLWIYRARPELACIVHTHPPYCSALSMTGEALSVAHMDAMVFYEDCAHLNDWPGVPLANEEGRLISEALGQKRSILLTHHGLLTTGKTLEEATYLAVLLEQAAQLHMLARSTGDIRTVHPDLARQAHDFLLQDSFVGATFDAWARRTARKYPEALG